MFRRYFPALGWSLAILFMSLLPGKSLPKVGWGLFEHLDKVAHLVVYCILALAIGWSFNKKKGLGWQEIFAIIAICTIYGIALEVMQYRFLSDRFFEIHDIIANIIGSIIGAVVVFLTFNKMKRL